MPPTPWLAAALAIALLSVPARTASAGDEAEHEEPSAWRLSASAGYEVDRGVFGNTTVKSAPLALRLEYGSWALGFAASALKVDGPSSVGRVKIGTASAAALARFLANHPAVAIDNLVRVETDNGWGYGDSMLTLSRAWFDTSDWLPFVEFSAGMKIPTGSTRKQHSTGKFDYLLQLDVAKTLGDWTGFASVGYRFNGSSYQPPILRLTDAAISAGVDVALGSTFAEPEPIPILDTLQTSVGFSFRATESALAGVAKQPMPLDLGVMYDWGQNAVAGIGDTHELIPFIALEWSRNVQIGPYLVIGLSKPAPDVGFAAQITVRY